MDLKIFFDTVPENLLKPKVSNSFLEAISIFSETMPAWREADIAIIGLTENRGNNNNLGTSEAANAVREKLYNLKKGSEGYHIVDLGNLRNGNSLEDTYLRIKEVCGILMEHQIVPILIGGSHDLDVGQFLSYENSDKLLNVLNVDAFTDMEAYDHLEPAQSHSQKIILHEPNYLFNYTNLGYQSYLTDANMLNVLETLHFDSYRLGVVQENISQLEPIVRDADMLSFDISAVRMQEAPGNPNGQAFGLTAQEACQLCWYAGHSNKLSSAGFYEFTPELDFRGQTASVVATMVWYLIDGYYARPADNAFESDHYLRYIVPISSDPAEIIFYKDKLTEKWWMEVPHPIVKSRYIRPSIIPCNYSDYQIACSGEIPDRWINIHTKLF